jgi:muramidase (phage lysozyme)
MDTIAYAEGTSTSKITKYDGYDIIVSGMTGGNRFDDFSDHPFSHGRPPVQVTKTLWSTAAGRYQIMLRWWGPYRDKLHLPSFDPVPQDRYCEQVLKERGAVKLLDAGDFYGAVDACSNIWASLPGKGNTYGQGTRKLDALKAQFLLHGGEIK